MHTQLAKERLVYGPHDLRSSENGCQDTSVDHWGGHLECPRIRSENILRVLAR